MQRLSLQKESYHLYVSFYALKYASYFLSSGVFGISITQKQNLGYVEYLRLRKWLVFGSSQIFYLCFHILYLERKQSLQQEICFVGVSTLKAKMVTSCSEASSLPMNAFPNTLVSPNPQNYVQQAQCRDCSFAGKKKSCCCFSVHVQSQMNKELKIVQWAIKNRTPRYSLQLCQQLII